jgi:NADPH:quinone reductase-like Zn-dependent oxidoreductase
LNAKCIRFYEFGSPKDVLKIEYKAIEPPKENEVLVRMLARPINPSDLIPIRGSFAHRISLPNIPGYEGVGIVEEVGPLVSKILLENVYYLYVVKGRGKNSLKHQLNMQFSYQILLMILRLHRCI